MPLIIPTFLKVGALLRSVERSGINGIPAYYGLWWVAADYSDLIKGRRIAKISGTVGNKRYSGLWRVTADYSDLCGNVPPQIPPLKTFVIYIGLQNGGFIKMC